MMKILGRTKKTGVKIFINTVMVVSPFVASHSYAAEMETPKVSYDAAGWEKQQTAQKCDSLRKDARDAERKISDACKTAGLGSSCASKAKECSETMGSSSVDNMSLLTSSLGLGSTASASSIQSACPQWSSKDWYEKKKDYQDDLQQAKEDISDIQKEKAEAEKELSDTLADIQEELNKAQEDLDQLSLDQNDKKRQRLQEFQENQAKLKQQIQENKIQKIQLEGQLTAKLQTATQELLALNSEAATVTCYDAITKKREAQAAIKTKGTNALLSKGNYKNNEYLYMYNMCMKNIDAQRKAAIAKKTTDEKTIRQQIVANEEAAAELQQSLESSQSQLTEIEADAKTEKDNAQTKVIKQMQLAQQKMTSANSNMQKKIQALQTKETALNQKINQINSDMTLTLGAQPVAGSTTTANEAASVIEGELGTIEDYADSGCAGAPTSATVKKKYGGSSGSKNR